MGSGVRLGDCDLAGIHNLHRLRIATITSFAKAPRGGRRVLGIERQWRCTRPVRSWWDPRGWLRHGWDATPPPPLTAQQPHEIAGTYRGLRVSREAAGDAPGAADLYYGEMEMRRHDSARSFGERAVVWLYWLFGGYGLRVLRPPFAMAVLLVGCTWLLGAHGLVGPHSTGDAVSFSMNSALSLLRPGSDNPALTRWGEVAQVVLKIGVPLLLGLTLLSIRGRVRR